MKKMMVTRLPGQAVAHHIAHRDTRQRSHRPVSGLMSDGQNLSARIAFPGPKTYGQSGWMIRVLLIYRCGGSIGMVCNGKQNSPISRFTRLAESQSRAPAAWQG